MMMTMRREQHDDVADDDQVALADRLEDEPAEAGEIEDVLDDDGAGEQEGELQAHDGDDRDQRVAQHVAAQGLCAGQALGARRAHPVLAQRVEHGGARHAREDRRLRQRQRDGRQQQRAEGRRSPSTSRGSRPTAAQPSVIENRRTSSSANQKFGTATPTWLNTMTPASAGRPWRDAAKMPSGNAIAVDKAIAMQRQRHGDGEPLER